MPVIEPPIKLRPTIKPIGNLIVSFVNKLTFLWVELFCIPIINIKRSVKLKMIEKEIFFSLYILIN